MAFSIYLLVVERSSKDIKKATFFCEMRTALILKSIEIFYISLDFSAPKKHFEENNMESLNSMTKIDPPYLCIESIFEME